MEWGTRNGTVLRTRAQVSAGSSAIRAAVNHMSLGLKLGRNQPHALNAFRDRM